MMDKLESLKAAEAKQRQILLKQQQALYRAQQARKQEEQRQHQQRWTHLGHALESALQLPLLESLTPAQVYDMWQCVARFLAEPSTCDIARDLLKIRGEIEPQRSTAPGAVL